MNLCVFYFYRIIGILTPFFADSIRVVNRKMKKIILLEFKQVSDVVETYFQDMWKVSELQHTPILTGLRTLTEE